MGSFFCYNIVVPNTVFDPSWKKYEKDLHSDDPQKALEAGIKFDEIRKEELRKDAKARRWEESRKESFLKDKPYFTKQRIQKEKEELQNITDKYRKGGFIMQNIKPSPGFVITKPLVQKSRETDSGIVLADSVETHEPNQSEVVAVGKDKLHVGGLIEEAPCKVGDKILHKFGTLELTLKGEKHNLMGFGDVLGVLEE